MIPPETGERPKTAKPVATKTPTSEGCTKHKLEKVRHGLRSSTICLILILINIPKAIVTCFLLRIGQYLVRIADILEHITIVISTLIRMVSYC
mmetsp:Transcript_43559/g.78345  ORF Transcript_43559/g.78345 Transcript_43559/m.78345 type:complete len:93 (-) Transcript_43559:97-375(-)